MSASLHRAWSQEEFFDWAQRQDEGYEFDGERPVAMTGGGILNALLMRSLHRALDARLRGTACQFVGPEAGVATVGTTVRYPDAVVTCSALDPRARTVREPVVVFEVLSPTTSRTDRIVKVREYAAVPSIRRYVLIEYATVALTVMWRAAADQTWSVAALTGEEMLEVPEVGIVVPIAEFYADVGLAEDA